MKPVYYSQEDKRWANTPYTITGDKSQTIGTSACGPTCFAMVASTFGEMVLPPEAAKFAVDNGYRTANSGTAWNYFSAAAKRYGLKCVQTGFIKSVKEALSKGALVIASMGPGHLTAGGHYVLLVGIRDGWIDVYDPNHDNRKYGSDGLIDQGVRDDGKVSVKEAVLVKEARQYWIFNRVEEAKPVMNAEDAEKVVAILQAAWQLDIRNAINTALDRKEISRLADEVRKAGGMPLK